jgi:hypothetical protein
MQTLRRSDWGPGGWGPIKIKIKKDVAQHGDTEMNTAPKWRKLCTFFVRYILNK